MAQPLQVTRTGLPLLAISLVLFFNQLTNAPWPPAQALPTPSFNSSTLAGTALQNPTSLQFGPDGRLYIAQQNGLLYAYTITRLAPNSYEVVSTEIISQIQQIPNHNDDGTPTTAVGRQVTGLYVTGSAAQPILYVSSSDPRIGAGAAGRGDSGLDTNSGVISRLTRQGSGWAKVDLVRGLPRSEENHATNGLQLDAAHHMLYVAQGGNTNAGSPSNNMAFLTEYALSAAILAIDLSAIDARPTQTDAEGQAFKYNLPTLNDPTGTQPPWSGNDGLNQALLVAGGPVQVYAAGFRNPYDLVLTSQGRLYAVDNGANESWGGYPEGEGPPTDNPPTAVCTSNHVPGEPGIVSNLNGLHFIHEQGYYGGHPNPVRANPAGAGLYTYGDTGSFSLTPTANWPPVPLALAQPIECDYQPTGEAPGLPGDNQALVAYEASTNGIAEYTATNFAGAMQGNLVVASFNGHLHRVQLNAAGDAVLNGTESMASGFGLRPLDVTAQGDNAIFPGTIWAATYGAAQITVFEPVDDFICTGADSVTIDEDGDRYSNGDEIDNLTNPCSAASRPEDNDGTEIDGFLVSDRNDPDDDDDGRLDTHDPLALDAANGRWTTPPLRYDLFAEHPGTGLGGLGFTGLMSNGQDYLTLLDPANNLILGGTSGLLTNPTVTPGDPIRSQNSQDNGLQFGLTICHRCAPVTIRTRVTAPFFNGQTPQGDQSLGFFIGSGDQDNYLKVVVAANGGAGGIQVLLEDEGQPRQQMVSDGRLLAPENTYVDLYLTVDRVNGIVQPAYATSSDAQRIAVGEPLTLPTHWLADSNVLAVGVLATSFGTTAPFAATWDLIEAVCENSTRPCSLPPAIYLPIARVGQ